MPATNLSALIDPEVMGAMIQAQLPKAIKFSGIAPIDTTLQGQPGSTITIPKFKYIGDAKDVAEGAAIDYTAMVTDKESHTIKKVAKGVELTDEAVLSGFGDPVGEGQRQVRMSIASKIDNDILEEGLKATLTVKSDINIDLIDTIENTFVDAPDAIEDDITGQTGVLFLSYKDAAKLRKEAGQNWTRASELGDNILISGAFGELLGWVIVRSKKVTKGQALAVKTGAMKTYLKRDLFPEAERDITKKLNRFNADQHYVVAIVDETKLVTVNVTVAP